MSQPQVDYYHSERVSSILKTFLEDIEYTPTNINPVNKELEDYMENMMNERGLTCEQLKKTLHCSASLGQYACYQSTLEEKKLVALFTWFLIYVDDKFTKDLIPFREFAPRLLRGDEQLDPTLTVLTEVLGHMWGSYDDMAASAIFNAALALVAGTCIEPNLQDLTLVQGVDRFSWYIRALSGSSIAYSLFPFTKKTDFHLLDVVQALPDMEFWIGVTNDLLSFHKEETAGETGTYIYNRAKNDNKSRYETCEELVAELRKARQTIHLILGKNPGALEIWKAWEQGYVEWHLIQERYHVKDLGILVKK